MLFRSGAIVAWQLAVLAPDRLRAVAALSVPFTPRPPVAPTELFRALSGNRFFYILYFQEPGVADRELGTDARLSLRKLMTGSGWGGRQEEPDGGLLDRIREPDSLPEWLSQDDLDVYVREFERTGFTGALDWYRNFDRNWELTPQLEGAKVQVPSLFIGGKQDPVLLMTNPEAFVEFLTDHRGNVLVDDAGHWVQQEKPEEVNAALIEFAKAVRPS